MLSVWSCFRPEDTNSRKSQLDNELIEVSQYTALYQYHVYIGKEQNVHLAPAALSLSLCIFFLFSLHLWQPTHHALPASGGLTLWHCGMGPSSPSVNRKLRWFHVFHVSAWQDMGLSTVTSATGFSISKGNMMWHAPLVTTSSVPHTVNLGRNDLTKILLQSS